MHSAALWPLLVYAVSAVALAAIMIGSSYVLGERHREQSTDEPYESGVRNKGHLT
jgi:NADH-quinone oxidoreductase subunit A